MSPRARLLLPLALAFLPFPRDAAVAAGERPPVAIPGTRVTLPAPEGFTLAQGFPGVLSEATSSSIKVTEDTTPVEATRQAVTPEALGARGMTLLRSEEIQVEGRPATLQHATQSAAGTSFRQWILLLGDETASVLVVGTTPSAREAEVGPGVEQAIRALRWDRARPLDLQDGLPFRVTESGSLRVSRRIGDLVSLTREGRRDPVGAAEPLLVVLAAARPAGNVDAAELGRRRLESIAQIRDLAGESGRAIEVGGRTGHEWTAAAKDATTGIPLAVYVAVVPTGDRVIVLQGLVGAEASDEFLPQFRAITETLRLE
jgi:hypothetical protein